MCTLLAGLGALLSIGQSVAGFAAAQQKADAQNQYYMENARAAQKATVNQYENLQTRRLQEKASADQQQMEGSIQALEKRGSAHVAASEAGVSGLSVDALIGNIYAQQGRRDMANDTNYQNMRQEIQTRMVDSQAGGQQRINGVQRAEQPDAFSFILQGASGILGGLGKVGMGSA